MSDRTRKIIIFTAAALIVLIAGALVGWFLYLRAQSKSAIAADVARGYIANVSGTPAPAPQDGAGAGSGFGAGGRAAQMGLVPADKTASTFTSSNALSRVLNTLLGRNASVSAPETLAPFGTVTGDFGTAGDIVGPAVSSGGSAQAARERPPMLWHISAKPVAGMAFFPPEADGSGTGELLRFVDRANGNVFEADPKTGSIVRLTNTLIPKVYEALFTGGGHVIERFINEKSTLVTFAGTLPTTAAARGEEAARLTGSNLAANIVRIAADPKADSVFYLVEDGANGNVAGIRALWDGTKQKRLFSSPIKSWNVSWLANQRIILAQSAADGITGYAYELKNDGTLVPLIDPLPGLTVLPHESGALIYGTSRGGLLELFVRVKSDATAAQLPIHTLADKCAWVETSGTQSAIAYCAVPQGTVPKNFLDNWYRGAVHTADALWRIDVGAGSAELVYTPPSALDIAQSVMNSAGTAIAFIDAADQSLWLLRLNE